MNLTKIKHKEIKRGDMLCNIDARVDRPVMIAFKDGNDPFFDPSTHNREVYRIDVPEYVIPDYIHELTQFSWKLKELDGKVESILNKRDIRIEEIMGEVNDLVRENDGLEEDKKRMYATMDRQRVTIGQQMDDVVELRMKIFDIEGREDLVTAELEHQIKDLSSKLAECRDKFVGRGDDSPITRMRRHISELREMSDIDERAWKKRENELLEMITARDEELAKCCDERDHDKRDLELLNMLLKRANPMIRTGMWRTTVGSCEFMRDVCQDVIDFRRKHNIVG
jgi:hypothetical protein